jgi:hypothetical protein
MVPGNLFANVKVLHYRFLLTRISTMGQSWDEDGLRLPGSEAGPTMPKGPRHQGEYINRGSSPIKPREPHL